MSPSRTREREAGSPAFLALAVLSFLVLAALYVESSRIPGGVTQRVLGDLGYLGLIVGVTTLSLIAIVRAPRPERRLWQSVAALYVVLLACEILWLWTIATTGSPPPPVTTPFFVLNSIAAVLYLTVVALLTPLGGSHRLVTARQMLDVTSFGVVVYAIVFFFSVVPLLSDLPASSPGDAVAGALFPTWAILMVAGLLWPLLVSGPGLLRSAWQRLLMVALLLYALAVGAWPLWFAWVMGPTATGDEVVLEIVQQLSHYVMFLALLLRLRRPNDRWSQPRTIGTPSLPARGASYLMIGFVMIAMPVMIALAIAAPEGSLTRNVLATTAAILAALTVARTLLTAIESGRLFRSSMTDPLTGLSNHRRFHEHLQSSVEVAARFDGSLAVVALDLDDFDQVNSRHGHPAGDEVLRQVGAALRDACGDAGVMCRVGGDEFAAVLPDVGAEGALQVALRARRALAAITAPDGARLTASSGIAVYPMHGDDAQTLLRMADGAAYWVKRHGKDHALVYSPTVVTELNPDDLVRVTERQAEAGVVRALAAAVDARHEHTSTHSVAVSGWATDVARRLGLDPERIRAIETAALLHDVGMVAVGEGVYDKLDSLADNELDEIRLHPTLGERIVADAMPAVVAVAIRHHHERWDGGGYPDGLRAVAIPLESRIIHICGAYDAMTSPRPFRDALSVAQAVDELRAGSGTQFDPELVEVFLEGLGALGRLRPDL